MKKIIHLTLFLAIVSAIAGGALAFANQITQPIITANAEAAEKESLIQLFESGVDLFLVEHNMDVVMKISHNITVINFGSKIAEGKPKEMQNNPEVMKGYLGGRYKAE